MGQFSEEELFGMTIRESANDGSDFTNPAADYRRLFLGEDGQLHVKDSAGSVTDIGVAGAPTTVDYVVGTASGSLSAEIVKAYLRDNYDPDIYPTSPATEDDEFEGGGSLDAKWTIGNDPGGADTPNQTDVAGILHIGLPENSGTDNVAAYIRLTQTAPTGTATARYRSKVCLGVSNNAAEHSEFAAVHISLIDVANGIATGVGIQVNNANAGFFSEWRAQDDAAGAIATMATNHVSAHMPLITGWVYLELRKTTTAAYTSANTYEAWASLNGVAWFQVGSDSVTFTANPVLGFTCRRPKSQTGTAKAEVYADFFRKVA